MASVDGAHRLGAIGTDAPLIPVQISRAIGASRFTECFENGFVADVAKAAPLQGLVSAISACTGIPDYTIELMWEGTTLDLGLSLQDNNVSLPGPAARRRGDRVVIMVDARNDALEAKERIELQQAKEIEVARLRKIREEEEYARYIGIEKERARQKEQRLLLQETEVDDWVASYLGVSEGRRTEMLVSREATEAWSEAGKTPVDQHFLVPCEPEVVAEIARVMGRSGVNATVLRAFGIENETLRRRYDRAKSLLSEGQSSIKQEATETQALCSSAPLLTRLGPCEYGINEYPMWHGTPQASSAGSICRNGFDTGYIGAHATQWGHGFYFADHASISHRYARGELVNAETGVCSVMLMCKVLAGNIKQLSNPPSPDEKEQLTAECLGSGGTFGSASEYHSLCGGGWAYVCAHRDQVLPAYVIVYKM